MAATTKTLSVDLAPLVDGADFATLRVWVTVDQPRLTDLTTGATRVGPFEAIKDEDTVTSAEVELPDNSWDPSPHWYRLHVQYRTLSFGDLQKWVSGSFQMDTDKTLADLPLEMPQAVDAVEYASFFELIEQADQARVDAVAAQQAAEEARDSAVEVATGDLVPALGALGLPQSGSDLSASIGGIAVPQAKVGGTNERIARFDTPVFDADFEYDAIFPNADGALVWKQMTVSAGYGGEIGDGNPISYFKAVGGSINHTGEGNLDAFWASVQHRGEREAGLFIGDLTSRKGGNAYGAHHRVLVTPDPGFAAPDFVVGTQDELVLGAERVPGQVAYGYLLENNGAFSASAAVQIGAPSFTGDKSTAAKSPFLVGINLDATAASPQSTAMRLGGSWGTGIDANANTITQIGALVMRNASWLNWLDSGGVLRHAMSLLASGNVRLVAAGAGQWEFYNQAESSMLARITASGRADFSTGGVTTKQTSAAAAPSRITDGHLHVWHDSANNLDYLVVDVNGTQKKVALT